MYANFPKAGEVWWANIPTTGDHRIQGRRPVIVTSHSGRNKNCSIVRAIPLSKYYNKIEKFSKSKSHTLLYKNDYVWLLEDSIVLCEQESSYDKKIFIEKLGSLNNNDLNKIAKIKINSEPIWFMRGIKEKMYEDDDFVYSMFEENRINQMC